MFGMYGIISQWVHICNLNLTFYVVGFVVNCIGFIAQIIFANPLKSFNKGTRAPCPYVPAKKTLAFTFPVGFKFIPRTPESIQAINPIKCGGRDTGTVSYGW